MNTYKVAIIGAGSIGANKPDHIDYPNGPNVLTHAHAVSAHPRTELMAFVDTDNAKAVAACEKWDVDAMYPSVDVMAIECKPDIVIVAVPTELHYDILMDILDRPSHPKLIIAEKPFCQHGHQAITTESLYKDCNVPIMVDYIRRFSPGHQEIKKQIESGKFGKALNCRVLYTRGLRHEGCHAIDLMRSFFGECGNLLFPKMRKENFINYMSLPGIHDRDGQDPSLHIHYEFEKCNDIIFQPCDGRKYGIFEVDICFENCRIRLIDNGLYYEMYPITEENEWGHKSLNYQLTDVLRRETGLNLALYSLINNAVNFLDGKEQLLCRAKDAIAVHEILEG